MKAVAECIPCLLGQVLELARRHGEDEWVHRKVLNEVMAFLPSTDFTRSPAEVVGDALAVARRVITADPFAETRLGLDRELATLAQELAPKVQAAPDPLLAAATAAAAGNVIDGLALGHFDVPTTVRAAFERGFTLGGGQDLHAAVGPSTRILYLLDNAGEVALDALFVDALRKLGKEVTLVARKGGLLHDATRADAKEAGLGELPLVDLGAESLLAALPVLASAEFRRALEAADLVIAKGSAAWETLGREKKSALFLLSVKCAPVARAIGCDRGDLVLLRV